jgi:hypothetical protein
MNNLLISGCCAGILLLGISCKKNTGQPTQSTNSKPFTIFSAIQYQGMPDPGSLGLNGFNLINETSLFTSKTDETPDSVKIAGLAIQAAGQPGIPACLDIEAWSYSSGQLTTTIDWYLEVTRIFKQYDSSGLGFYGVVPNDAYSWGNIQPAGSAHYVQWQSLNASLAPIAGQINRFFPSFYTDDNDTASWKDFVSATLSELKKYNVNKPVYAFLWPQYHDGSPDQYQFVDTAVWKCELETLYPQVDGLVIWSSSKTLPGVSNVWDETWPWWTTTQAFMSEHHIP